MIIPGKFKHSPISWSLKYKNWKLQLISVNSYKDLLQNFVAKKSGLQWLIMNLVLELRNLKPKIIVNYLIEWLDMVS